MLAKLHRKITSEILYIESEGISLMRLWSVDVFQSIYKFSYMNVTLVMKLSHPKELHLYFSIISRKKYQFIIWNIFSCDFVSYQFYLCIEYWWYYISRKISVLFFIYMFFFQFLMVFDVFKWNCYDKIKWKTISFCIIFIVLFI